MIFVYPGSFDPITNGHLDVINRAVRLCDKLIVAVGTNISKKPAFSVEERMDLIRASVGENEKISVMSFSGLLVDFARKNNSKIIIKGLRAMSDFEYEFQMALLNKQLDSDMETLFMMTSVNYSFLSSSVVKEIAINGGNIEGLVPDSIKDRIIKKLSSKNI